VASCGLATNYELLTTGPGKVEFPDPDIFTIANADTGKLLHTSNYELQRANYGITMWLHVAWLRITNYLLRGLGKLNSQIPIYLQWLTRTQGNYSIPRITNYNAQTMGLQCGFMWPGRIIAAGSPNFYGIWETQFPGPYNVYGLQVIIWSGFVHPDMTKLGITEGSTMRPGLVVFLRPG
jgi:hypothetical protein